MHFFLFIIDTRASTIVTWGGKVDKTVKFYKPHQTMVTVGSTPNFEPELWHDSIH